MPKEHNQLLDKAAKALRGSRHAIAFTGAGISVPSGIPDFRSPGGLWSKFDPSRVASLTALRSNPKAVWEFLLEANRMIGKAEPNAAHQALARLEEAGRLASIVTQNIDGLHQAAGSQKVIEFHGGCTDYYCMGCRRDFDPAEAMELTEADIPWTCADCGGVVRPSVVFFGEGIPPDAMRQAQEETGAADLVIIVGTSGDVQPANLLPVQIKRGGGTVIEINLGETAFSNVTDIRFDAPCEKVLPKLAELVC